MTNYCGSFTNNDWLAVKLNQSGTTALSYQYRGASGSMGTDAWITVEYSELESPTLAADWTTIGDATTNVLTNVSTTVNTTLANDNVKWVRFSYVGTKGTMVDNITINQLATTALDYSFESSEFTSYSSGHSSVGAGGVTYNHNDGSEFTYSEGSWTVNNGATWGLIRTGDWSWGCTNDTLTVKLPTKYDGGVKGFSFYHKAFNSNAYGTLTYEFSADGTTWSPAGSSTVDSTVWEQVAVDINSETAQYIRITQTGGSGSGVLGIDDLTISAYGEGPQTISQEPTVVQISDRAFEGEARDVQMLSFSVPVTGTLDPYTLTELVLSNTGTAAFGSDLGNVKIYHTGTESNYLKAVAETNATEIYNGAFGTGTITITTPPELVSGTNYFFVIYALESAANGGDTLDCAVTGYTFTENVNNGNGDVTQTGWANGNPDGDNIVIRTTGGTKTIIIFMIGGQSNAAGKGLGQYYDLDNQNGTTGVQFWLGGSNATLGIDSKGSYENVASTDFAADVPMATGNRDGATDLLSDAGVEITLAKELKAQLPSDDLAIIKYGYSGSGLGVSNGGGNLNWYPGTDGDPDTYDADLGWRYRVFRDSAVLPALRKITENGDSFEILGFYWIQGEADSGRTEAAYRTDLVNLYDRMSREFNSPGMYFYNQRLNSARYSGSAIYTLFTKFGRELISSDVAADQTNVGAYTTADIGPVNFDLDNVYTIDGNPYGADTSNVENNPNPGMFDGDLHYNSQALEEMGELVAAHYGQTVIPVLGMTISIDGEKLSWTIAEEIDVAKYIVERYENGAWITYTTVIADNSANYQVTVEEGYAYRLTVVDNSGYTQTFSPENENISVITVNLNKGWNLVSSPVEDDKMNQVWCWNGSTYYIGNAKPLEGFWLYAEQAKKIDFVGKVTTKTTKPLATGWNLLGPSENIKVPNLLIYSYDNIYQQMLNDYDLLLQGHGYWIFSLGETTIAL